MSGRNIDPELLSSSQAEFAKLARKLSGLEALEITEFITLNKYKYEKNLLTGKKS